jgi:hypothetical protein
MPTTRIGESSYWEWEQMLCEVERNGGVPVLVAFENDRMEYHNALVHLADQVEGVAHISCWTDIPALLENNVK